MPLVKAGPDMDIVNIWVALLLVPTSVVLGEEFHPKLLEPTDCSKPGVPCVIREDAGCALSLGADDTGIYPDLAHGIQVRSTVATPDFTISISNVSIKWDPPVKRDHLLGFGIRLIKNHEKQFCFLFDVTGATWFLTSTSYEFQLNLALTHGGYDIEIISLPEDHARSPLLGQTAMVAIPQKYFDENPQECNGDAPAERSCWATDIIMYSRPCDGTLKVSFAPAPSYLGIRSYIVSLNKKSTSYTSDVEQVITVENMKANATLHLHIINLPLKDRNVNVIPRDSVCDFNACRTSGSQYFDIPKPLEGECVSTKTSTTPAPGTTSVAPSTTLSVAVDSSGTGLSPGILASVILATIILTALVLVIIVLAVKRCPRERKGLLESSISSSNHSDYVDPIPAWIYHGILPVVFIIYSNDHQKHMELIARLVTFLQRFCSCDVVYAPDYRDEIVRNKLDWLTATMRNADHILLINSEGTYNKCLAYQRGTICPSMTATDDCYDLGDLFTPALEVLCLHSNTLLPKLFTAYFPYTPGHYRRLPLSDLDNKKINYMLLDHISALCCTIHGTDARFSEAYTNLENSGEVCKARNEFNSNMNRPDWLAASEPRPHVSGCGPYTPRSPSEVDSQTTDSNLTVDLIEINSKGYTKKRDNSSSVRNINEATIQMGSALDTLDPNQDDSITLAKPRNSYQV